ncbi:hypothetical protein RFI_37822, partial [Reticulomyxa filosa]
PKPKPKPNQNQLKLKAKEKDKDKTKAKTMKEKKPKKQDNVAANETKKWKSLDEMLQHMLNDTSQPQDNNAETTTNTKMNGGGGGGGGEQHKLLKKINDNRDNARDKNKEKERENESKIPRSPTLSAKSRSSMHSRSHLIRAGDDYNRWDTSSVASTNWSNYRELFLNTKRKILKAEVLGFNGKCTDFEPFKWASHMVDLYGMSIYRVQCPIKIT